MDKSKAYQCVVDHVAWIRHSCGVDDWELFVIIGRIDGSAGEAHSDAPYLSCEIYLDHEESDDENELLLVLRHEIMHATLGMQNVNTNIVKAVIGPDDARGNAVVEASRHFQSEQMVLRLEKIFRINRIPLLTPKSYKSKQELIYRSTGSIHLTPNP